MNFLKKKLKPLTSGFNQSTAATSSTASSATTTSHSRTNQHKKDLEDDLYDEYVVEAPPHPSELIALRELYRKAREEGKDKKFNSVLLARQRQKEEIEEKKRTREEWKFFDSLTSRVEQVVKESQKNLNHWRESSAVSELTEPEYELRQTADEVFRSVTAAKLEKGANNWIDFDEDAARAKAAKQKEQATAGQDQQANPEEEFDEFGCPKRRASSQVNETQNIVVKEILEDFGIDLRTAEQRKAFEKKQKEEEEKQRQLQATQARPPVLPGADSKPDKPEKIVARPRPRPKGAVQDNVDSNNNKADNHSVEPQQLDPFDTSFVAPEVVGIVDAQPEATEAQGEETSPPKALAQEPAT
jgi:hypothetical protein